MTTTISPPKATTTELESNFNRLAVTDSHVTDPNTLGAAAVTVPNTLGTDAVVGPNGLGAAAITDPVSLATSGFVFGHTNDQISTSCEI